MQVDKVKIDEEKVKADEILKAATPLLEAAKQALNNVSVKDIQEMKALNNPMAAIKNVALCILYLKPIKGLGALEGWEGCR